MSMLCYIPSKDRAQQLDLLLRSLHQNAPGLFNPYVVYTASNEDFAEGYRKLRYSKMGDLATFYKEDNSEKNFYDFLEKHAANNELVALFSDDCIFYRPTDIDEKCLRAMFEDQYKIWSFTFRLGKNITIRDYVDQRKAEPPAACIDYGNKFLVWEWQLNDFWDMFGFACGFDGYIYRAKDLLELTKKESFGRICYWEGMFCRKFNENKPLDKPYMACPIISNVAIEQINITHSHFHRSTKAFNVSTEELNKKWLAGEEIDLDSFDWSNLQSCHGEFPFTFSYKKN